MAVSVFTVFYLDPKIWVVCHRNLFLDMAHAHDRLTNILGKMERTKKITRICQEKALNFLGVMESTKDDIRTISKTKNTKGSKEKS
jgi:hypothetical protein